MMVEEKIVTHERMGLVLGWCIGMLYVDDGLVGLRDPEWLQGALNMLIGIFRWYGLVANVVKYKAMTCQTGEILSGMSEDAVNRRSMERG